MHNTVTACQSRVADEQRQAETKALGRAVATENVREEYLWEMDYKKGAKSDFFNRYV
ncbi:hypothetical protein [Pseudomonas sp. NBRC 111124]|uniref:hypothetical protein n=1 Tax=Pseudomonas sp. NBRC 111124 TaxID=1661039 RepID=UPI000AABFA27|nr:hypothetical protein [Pseudomonas sp. NBRC 111124]